MRSQDTGLGTGVQRRLCPGLRIAIFLGRIFRSQQSLSAIASVSSCVSATKSVSMTHTPSAECRILSVALEMQDSTAKDETSVRASSSRGSFASFCDHQPCERSRM